MSRDVLTVGSTMRIPLLYQGEYSQWVERFMNYLVEQTDEEAMINSIKNGDQPLPRVTQVSIAGYASTEQPTLKDKSMWSDQEKRVQKIDHLARSLLIQGLPNDIYSLIDSNKTAKDLWDALARHMLGSEYGEQDRKAAVLQNKNLMDINIDALYNILKQNQGDVNDAMGSKRKTVVVTSDPLALIAEKTKVTKSKEKVVVSLNSEGKASSSSADEKILRQAQIEQDEAFSKQLEDDLNANINWKDVVDQVKRKERQDNTVIRYQALKRKPVTEAQARKNIMVYLKNMAGFKMDFFRGMTYNDIRPIFENHYNLNQAFLERVEEEVMGQEEEERCKRKGEDLKQDAAKKQRNDKEVEEITTNLQIIANDNDDVYTEATPLASKVPVVDYQIHHEHNKPDYKIIKADGTHQLFLSSITLLKNFDREDLEMLWKLVQERFQSS
nr:DUF4219 domain-containing protein/UBN2 domain-containing protein [Tanacetum cinerariifolium]